MIDDLTEFLRKHGTTVEEVFGKPGTDSAQYQLGFEAGQRTARSKIKKWLLYKAAESCKHSQQVADAQASLFKYLADASCGFPNKSDEYFAGDFKGDRED